MFDLCAESEQCWKKGELVEEQQGAGRTSRQGALEPKLERNLEILEFQQHCSEIILFGTDMLYLYKPASVHLSS